VGNRGALALTLAVACVLALAPLCPCLAPAAAPGAHGCCPGESALQAPAAGCCRDAGMSQAGPGDVSAPPAAGGAAPLVIVSGAPVLGPPSTDHPSPRPFLSPPPLVLRV
jgi:hypothetical protein